MNFEDISKFIRMSGEQGRLGVSSVTLELIPAIENRNDEAIARVLMDFDQELDFLDRALIAEYLTAPRPVRRGRPGPPKGLPFAILGLSLILEFCGGYSQEGARVARITELTGLSENTVRNHIRSNSEWQRENMRVFFEAGPVSSDLIGHFQLELEKLNIYIDLSEFHNK